MLRYRRMAREADVVHFQWLSVQALDTRLLPRQRPRVLTAHDVLPREPKPSQLAGQRALYEQMDAVIVHSEHGAGRLRDEVGLDPAKVHVIPHGVLDNLVAQGGEAPFAKTRPVVLFFGLIRPYKGLDVLLEAWREADLDAELWVVGMPRMDASFVHGPNVRTALRFVSNAELAGAFRAADLVVLPYREIDQSGVLFTAMAFGKPLLLTRVGGFPEIAGAELVEPGDPHALAHALQALMGDPARLARMAAVERPEYGWDAIARRTLAVYSALQA
jgi:glycosyltransferase involved in cell wall biosynthesis